MEKAAWGTIEKAIRRTLHYLDAQPKPWDRKQDVARVRRIGELKQALALLTNVVPPTERQ